MSWFEVLAVATAVVRGMGAGIIYDSAVVSPRVRHRVGLPAYADYLRANLAGLGGKSYVPVAWLGALLTIATTVAAFVSDQPRAVAWWTAGSLSATVLAFLGTGLALPARFRVVRTTEDEHLQLKSRLDRYASWYAFSAFWQAMAFLAAVLAVAGG
ncbi:hypothetical protein ACIHDR_48880 [Nocardia sp. NPDC052278]|uniref:hypothetical protein n=1 Tax=unclassified Nocardia TaxID=2637762 RepID=UPI0036CCD976